MPGSTLQGSQFHYFTHDVMRFFAHAVLQRPYEAAPASGSRNGAFSFDSGTRAIIRPSDPLTPLALRDFRTRRAELRHVAAWWVRHLRSGTPQPPLFRVPGLGPRGLAIHARDTSMVIVQRRPRRVWKLVRNASLRELLERERDAARLAPALAPAVSGWHEPGDTSPGYVALEYVLDTDPVADRDLADALRHITPALMDVYRRAGIRTSAPGQAAAALAHAEAALNACDPSLFTSAAREVLQRIRSLVDRHEADGRPQYRTFAHGDLQTSNLRRAGRGLRLIDWANGGMHNVLFDAFIVELFAPTPDVWAEVLTTGTVTDRGRGFRGWLPLYLDGLAAAGVTLRDSDVAAALVCSMAEKAAGIVVRHAATDEARGLHSLGRIQRLLSAASVSPSPT